MQQTVRWRISGPSPRVAASSLLVASAAVLLSGCSAGADEMPTVAVPADRDAQTAPGAPDPALNVPGRPDASDLAITDRQRAYLDALEQSGVHPSSELIALSIGTYVCQARAAGQSDQEVWDFVVPLVRGDVHDTHPDARSEWSTDLMATKVDRATGDYIRVATEQLC